METMVDIEAMGGPPDGAIVSIGAVSFDPAQRIINLEKTFYERVSLDSSCLFGMKIDPWTVRWWLKQSDEARWEAANGIEKLNHVLERFLYWCQGNVGVWAHGTTYDIAILTRAFELTNLPLPWRYRHVYDTRAVLRLAGIGYKSIEHHALKDAIGQAKSIIEAYDILGNRKEGVA